MAGYFRPPDCAVAEPHELLFTPTEVAAADFEEPAWGGLASLVLQ